MTVCAKVSNPSRVTLYRLNSAVETDGPNGVLVARKITSWASRSDLCHADPRRLALRRTEEREKAAAELCLRGGG